MAQTTLVTVRNALGKTGQVTLSEVGASDGYTRNFTTAATDYKRINPFEAAAGRAPQPSDGAPYNLNDWDGYSHTTVPTGTDINATSITTTQITIEWTKPTGYPSTAALGSGTVGQKIYLRACSPNNRAGCTDDDPTSDTYLIQTTDGTSHTEGGLSIGQWYNLGMRTVFDEGDASDIESGIWSGKSTQTESGQSYAGNYGIEFRTDTTTTTTTTACANEGEDCTVLACCPGLTCGPFDECTA